MKFSRWIGSRWLLMIAVLSLASLGPVFVEAGVIPSHSLSSIQKRGWSDWFEPTITPIESATNAFWAAIAERGVDIEKVTKDIIEKASESSAAVKEKFAGVKRSIENVASTANGFREQLLLSAEKGGMSPEKVSALLSTEFDAIFRALQAEFPPLDHAPNHEERTETISIVFQRAEEALMRVGNACGLPEDQTKSFLDELFPHIQDFLILTGDFVELHPTLVGSVILVGALVIMPENILLRPILNLFGFGPSGPVKGSVAAWAQRRFFGAAVTEGSWFAVLQSAGMKLPAAKAGIIRWISGCLTGILKFIFPRLLLM